MFDEIIQILTPAMVFPLIIIVFLVLFFIYYIKISRPERATTEWIDLRVAASERRLTLINQRHQFTTSDVVPICLITTIFALLAIFCARLEAQPILPAIFEDNMHPPLGREILYFFETGSTHMLQGQQVFTAISGALMLTFIYLFVKTMFGKTPVAVCATLIFGFETMRLSLSAAGSITIISGLLVLLSYYFMYLLITTEPGTKFSKSILPMALSGVFFGLAVAVKWTSIFAGIGLFLIFCIRLIQYGLHTDSNDEKHGKTYYRSYFIKTVAFSFLFYIIIPIIIYYLSYIPLGFSQIKGAGIEMIISGEYINMFTAEQDAMLSYHAKISETALQWRELIFTIYPTINPQWYSATNIPSMLGIFGNAVIFWSSPAIIIAMLYRIITHRDGKALIILLGYLPGYLSWLIIPGRENFALHYFSSIIFIVLACAHIFDTMIERKKKWRWFYMYGFTTITGVAFAVFYPIIAKIDLPAWYYDVFTNWIPK